MPISAFVKLGGITESKAQLWAATTPWRRARRIPRSSAPTGSLLRRAIGHRQGVDVARLEPKLHVRVGRGVEEHASERGEPQRDRRRARVSLRATFGDSGHDDPDQRGTVVGHDGAAVTQRRHITRQTHGARWQRLAPLASGELRDARLLRGVGSGHASSRSSPRRGRATVPMDTRRRCSGASSCGHLERQGVLLASCSSESFAGRAFTEITGVTLVRWPLRRSKRCGERPIQLRW